MAKAISPAETAVMEKLLLGQLPPDEVERLAVQYADSRELQQLAQSLAGDDTFLESLRNQTTAPDEPADDSLAEKLVSRLSLALSRRDNTVALPAEAVEDDAEATPEMLEYFRIDKVLGQGGMGTVYLAEDTRLGRKVAIKTLRKELAKKAAAKERFLREARTAAKLEHDHVIPIHYVGESAGVPFLAMPFLKGLPLDAQQKQTKGLLPLTEVIRIGRETALGLAAAHAEGLIHRDIKPANIWLESPHGRVKILDFGLARSQSEEAHLTASGTVMGTPAYMAPEQARGLPVDARADLFSLGVVLYELSTGKKPFTGPDMMAILTSLALDNPPAANAVNPAIPPKLAALIERLMAKEPGKRPMTAQVVADELAQMAVQASRPTIEEIPDVFPPAVAVAAADPWGGIDDRSSPTEIVPAPKSDVRSAKHRPAKRGPNKLLLAGASLFGLLVIAAGIVVIVRDKDGKKIAEVTVPENGTVTVSKDGKKIAEVRPDANSANPKERPVEAAPSRIIDFPELARSKTAWTVLRPVEMKAEGGTTLTLQDDGSVLAGGKLPDQDSYTLAFRGLPPRIQALRLEVLPHDTLPTKGPGRAADGRFVLTKIKARLEPLAKTGKPADLKLTEAWADHSTGDDSREQFAIDEDDLTGWVTESGKPHFAAFKLESPVAVAEGGTLRVTLEFKHDSPQALLGCFRLSAAGPAAEPDRLAAEWVLSLGGKIDIDGKRVKDLRAGPVTLTAVTIQNHKLLMPDDFAKIKDCAAIRYIDFTGSSLTDEGFTHFNKLINVDELHVHATKITNAAADILGQMKRLKQLNVSRTGMTDEAMNAFASLASLESLNLKDNAVTDTGLARLNTLTNLTQLDLRNTKVSAKAVADFAKAVPGCRIEHDGGVIEPKKADDRRIAEWILTRRKGDVRVVVNGQATLVEAGGRLPTEPFRITTATMNDDGVSDDDLSRLAGLTELTELNFHVCPITTVGLAKLPPAPKLIGLNLERTKLNDAGLPALLKFPALRVLVLSSNDISDDGLKHLASMPGLTELTLKQTKVTGKGVKELAARLPKCKIEWDGGVIKAIDPDRQVAEWILSVGGSFKVAGSDDEIREMAKFPKEAFRIQLANLAGNLKVNDDNVDKLTACRWLTKIHLFGTQVTDRGISKLQDFSGLAEFSISNPAVTNASLDYLKKNTGLQHLNFYETKLTDDGFAHLREFNSLEQVILVGNAITDAVIPTISRWTTLTYLDVRKTKLTAEGLKKIAAKLPKCRIEWDGGVIEAAKQP